MTFYAKFLTTIIVLIIFAAGWYFLSPLFFDETINEGFPLPPVPTNEELAEMTPDELETIKDEVLLNASQHPAVSMDEEMPHVDDSEPTLVRSGEFKDADSFHKGTGTAGIYNLVNGTKVLRLENLIVTNGPDLHVLLAKNADPLERKDIDEGYEDLGSLKGNIGDQNYTIPAEIDVSAYGSVVIYCKPFHVIFSTAALR